MPYKTNDELPEYIHKYSEKKQSQWRHVFNSVYAKVLGETKDSKQAEERAFQAANSVLKKSLEKQVSNGFVDHADEINRRIDTWLGNLRG